MDTQFAKTVATREMDQKYTDKFRPSAIFVESNPFKYGTQINCGRYYTGSKSSLSKKMIYEEILAVMRESHSDIIIREADIVSGGYGYHNEVFLLKSDSLTPDTFLKAKEESGSHIDLHFYGMGGSWSACLDSTEEVVIFCDTSQRQNELISRLGGAELALGMIEADLEYLAQRPFWTDHQKLIIAR